MLLSNPDFDGPRSIPLHRVLNCDNHRIACLQFPLPGVLKELLRTLPPAKRPASITEVVLPARLPRGWDLADARDDDLPSWLEPKDLDDLLHGRYAFPSWDEIADRARGMFAAASIDYGSLLCRLVAETGFGHLHYINRQALFIYLATIRAVSMPLRVVRRGATRLLAAVTTVHHIATINHRQLNAAKLES